MGITSQTSRLHTLPFHPLFFAAYPILALLAFNSTELNFSDGLRALFLSVVVAGLLFLVLRWIYRDSKVGALATSAVLILFYSYGHIQNLLMRITVAGVHPFQHRTLIPLWLGIAAWVGWWLSRRPKQISSLTYVLNIIGPILVILPVFQMIFYSVQRELANAGAQNRPADLTLQVGQQPPDIYYIILDGYGRSDVLKKYGYDNSDFLNELRNLGFFIADCAQSNYAQTKLSLASSLNFNYLDQLSDRFVAGSTDRTGLNALIHYSAVRKSLEKAGYKTVAFATGYPMTELSDADNYLAPPGSWKRLNGFESLLVHTTLAGGINIQRDSSSETADVDPQLSREHTLFVLANLDQVAQIPGPKFVFAHIVSPHPPYVFGPTGGPPAPVNAGEPRTAQIAAQYRDQAIYISSRIMEIVPRILANSATPPVIVIQGDHGPTIPSAARQRMMILNAYYLPGAKAALYPTITPVNSFRVIFNTYFGQNVELLEDVSLYSHYRHPFDYRVIPNSCK